jgi:hypothetical protein
MEGKEEVKNANSSDRQVDEATPFTTTLSHDSCSCLLRSLCQFLMKTVVRFFAWSLRSTTFSDPAQAYDRQ